MGADDSHALSIWTSQIRLEHGVAKPGHSAILVKCRDPVEIVAPECLRMPMSGRSQSQIFIVPDDLNRAETQWLHVPGSFHYRR